MLESNSNEVNVMDPSKVRESQKTKHFLSLLRIMAGSVWIILWLFLFSVYDPDSGNGLFAALLYPGIILFLFAADWTGRKVYGIQVRIAFQEICSTVQSFDPASDYGVLLRNDVVSGVCQKSLLLDRCGNDPYKDTWEVLYKSATQRFYSLVFSKPPVNLSDQGIRLLQLLLGLGSYGLSHGYLSPYNWSRDRRDLAGLVNEFHLTGFIDDFVANADKK